MHGGSGAGNVDRDPGVEAEITRCAARIECDVAVVGAGPATSPPRPVRDPGSPILLDEGATPGEIYRAVTRTPLRRSILDADYWQGGRPSMNSSERRFLTRRGDRGSITPDLEIAYSKDGRTSIASARSDLATGAIERRFPIPGWTLPGVMSLGAAQSLLKSSGLVPSGRIVIAGTGPLVWLAASQMLAAGASIAAILDTTPHENRSRALQHLPGFLFSPYLRRAMKLLLAVRGRVQIVPYVTELHAGGQAKVESVSYRTAGEAGHAGCRYALLHQRVVPETHLAMAAGVAHRWDPLQLCWTPAVDRNGGTSVPGILARRRCGHGGARSPYAA
jgi:hypothetical protein